MGLRLVGLGVAIGLLASLGATRVLADQLWGVSPHDPLTLAAVVGRGGAGRPGRLLLPGPPRPPKVDPMVALRG